MGHVTGHVACDVKKMHPSLEGPPRVNIDVYIFQKCILNVSFVCMCEHVEMYEQVIGQLSGV